MNKTLNSITLLGYYGRQNSGDDAMLYGMLLLLYKSLPHATLNVPTNSNEICIPLETYNQVSFFPRRLFPILTRIIRSDAVIIGGGTILHDHSHRFRYHWTTIRYLVLILWAKLISKRVYMVGIGFGPFTTKLGLLLAKLVSKLVDYITVRDSDSVEFLKKIGFPSDRYHLTFDLACLLNIENSQPTISSPILGVSLLPFFFGYSNSPDGDRYLADVMAKALNAWLELEPEGKIHLLTFLGRSEGDGDISIINAVVQQIEDSNRIMVIPYSSDPRQLLAQTQVCTSLVTMRYHAAVYGYMTQRPMVIINYHPKCETFAKDINFLSKLLSIDELMNGELLSHLSKLSTIPEVFKGKFSLSEAKQLARRALPPELRGENQCV